MVSAWSILAFSPPSGEGETSGFLLFVPYILIFVIFYFLLIAPARKKQKKHGEMLAALKNGDKVVTSGGIHGTIVGVTDAIVHLRIADKVKIEVSKNAVAAIQHHED